MSATLPHVHIAMCTYNAGDSLPAQLTSFLSQDHRDWSLWVSDDGSTDDTLTMLERFRDDVAGQHEVHILQGPGARLGSVPMGRSGAAARNFLSLLCHPDLPRGAVALSDQDDVWLRGKLSRALRWLTRAGAESPGQPLIYGAQSFHVDSALTLRGKSRHALARADFRNALVENIMSGHSMVLAPEALDLVRRAGWDLGVPFHDWWIYQLVTGAGGRALVDPRHVLLYRQHGGNVLGASTGARAVAARLAKVTGSHYRDWLDANLAALSQQDDLLTPDARAIVADLAPPGAGWGPARVAQFRRLGLHRQSGFGTGALMALAFAGRA